MIFAIILGLETFLGYKVWTEEDRTRLFLWFMSAIFLLPPNFKLMPGVPSVNWLFPIICTARFVREKTIKECWKAYPLRTVYTVMLVFHFVQPFFARFLDFRMTYFYIVQYVMITYLYLFLGFCIHPNIKELFQYKKWIYILIGVLFLISAYSKATNFNFITAGLNNNSFWSADMLYNDRGFRVTATQDSPNIFGFINVLLALFVYAIDDKYWRKAAAVGMLVFNIIVCGTRTPFVGFVLMSSLYLFFEDMKKLFRMSLIGAVAGVIAINVLGSNPVVEKYLGGVVDLFTTGGQNTGGSSVEGRGKQLDAAIAIADTCPVWGSGNGYCEEFQREDSPFYVFYNSDLLGAEGYVFYTFIDYGYVYTGICGLLYASVAVILLVNLRRDKRVAVLALCTFACLMLHLVTSRPNNNWQVFMPFIGACMYYLLFKDTFKELEGEEGEQGKEIKE